MIMSTFKIFLFALIHISFCNISLSQDIKLIKYNLHHQTLDTIPIEKMINGSHEQTLYNKGNINSIIANLEDELPTDNLAGHFNFTHKHLTEPTYNISEYPIRTSIRLNYLRNDSLFPLCSGSMVSPNLVLSAKHCITSIMDPNSNHNNELFVTPVFNNGLASADFYGSQVKNIYITNINGIIPDIVILELKEPIGKITGWLGIGFEEDQFKLQDKIFYKFSYPAASNYFENGIDYNGDTLYCGYGQLNYFTNQNLGLVGHSLGIPGESGSSIFAVKKDEYYTAYGVLSTILHYSHTRITKPIYSAFHDLIVKNSFNENTIELSAYPNPVSTQLFLYNLVKSNFENYSIYDIHGRKLQTNQNYNEIEGISFNNYPEGIYFLSCQLKSGHITIKVIKH